jgi:hypothetical protein
VRDLRIDIAERYFFQPLCSCVCWGGALKDVGQTLSTSGPRVLGSQADIILRGYSGYNTRWALFLLDVLFPKCTREPPALVTIFFGANDAALADRARW